MSYDLRFMLVALFGLATLYWILAALKRGLLGRPRMGTAWLAAAAYAMAALIARSAWQQPVLDRRDFADFPESREFEVRADPRARSAAEQARVDSFRIAITPALERYQQEHGKYPDALEDAGISTPQTAYGPLHYYGSRSENPHWYLVSFGDPGVHGFEAEWDSRTGRWQVFEFDL
jgi:hypothetical protein